MIHLLFTTTLLLTATWFDQKQQSIPNRLTYGGIVFGTIFSILNSMGVAGITDVGLVDSVSGLLVCFSVMFVAWLWLSCGAADVKLAGALGALLGFSNAISALMIAYLIAGFFALGWAAIRTSLVPAMSLQTFGYVPSCLLFLCRGTELTIAQELARRFPMAGFYAAGTFYVILFGAVI